MTIYDILETILRHVPLGSPEQRDALLADLEKLKGSDPAAAAAAEQRAQEEKAAEQERIREQIAQLQSQLETAQQPVVQPEQPVQNARQ